MSPEVRTMVSRQAWRNPALPANAAQSCSGPPDYLAQLLLPGLRVCGEARDK